MKLIRKQNTPIFIDQYGIEHPGLTLSIVSINEDKLNKRIKFNCLYFHTQTCENLPLFFLGEVIFDFSNQYVNSSPGNNGWPTYDEVKEDISIDNDGNLVPLNTDMGEWILNQPYVLDLEGKKFVELWELTN